VAPGVFRVVDEARLLDFLCYKEDKSVSKQARVLAHKAPSKLQGGNSPLPLHPSLNSRLHRDYASAIWSMRVPLLRIEKGLSVASQKMSFSLAAILHILHYVGQF